MAGCAATSHEAPKVDETRVKQFAGRGYLSDDRFSIDQSLSSIIVGDHSFDIAWVAPVLGASLPVVVYLPGLGESRTSGESWRTSWARAGYAVVSIQLLEQDQKAWSSAAARRGDFASVARERYSTETVNARMKALAAVLTDLSRRHLGDVALLQRVDLSRVAIAGFDVGAYTSMLVAGETPKGIAEPVRLPIPVAAVVALSPFADFSGMAFSARYQSIFGPVLSVTSIEDADSLGVVTSPSVRKAPFEFMPSRDAYLLSLANATHAIISGSAPGPAEKAEEATPGSSGESQGTRQEGSRRGARRGGSGASSASGSNTGDAAFSNRRAEGPTASPTERALNVVLVQGVTTAFLDAYMKLDPTAREWLQIDAPRWIGARGEWKWK